MTIYALPSISSFPVPLHPEDAVKVITDNCGRMYYIERTEDQDGDHDEVVWCHNSLQDAWQELLDRQDYAIRRIQEERARLLKRAIEHGYIPKE